MRGYRTVAHELHGVPVHSSGGQRTWRQHDLTDEQHCAVWAAIETRPYFWNTLGLTCTEGEIEELQHLARQGARFVYITARPLTAALATTEWLLAHDFPGGDFRMTHDKAEAIQREYPEITGFLDDSPEVIKAMWGQRQPVYVRDWPYNRAPLRGLSLPRVGSLGEFLAAVA